MSKQVRVRFAPSPTGHLHIGGARSALFNYLFARHHGGDFIVRIEDTDRKRNVEEAEAKLIESLRWFGTEWDESIDKDGGVGPYRSMDRLDIYKEYIDKLVEEGKAYHCYCTEEELNAEREAMKARCETPRYSGKCRHLAPEQIEAYKAEGRTSSIRFRVPENREYIVHDHIRGEVKFESNGIGDFVIARPDGIPTYNFAVVIDDYLMKITHVIRGEEHLSNTPRQLMIYEAFGFEAPEFAHVALILNPDGKKMSKRDESLIQFVEQYRDLGYLPEALMNFLALLGWSPEEEREIFTREELIDKFSLSRVSKSPAIFDIHKLNWMNNHYIKQAPVERIAELCIPHMQKAGQLPQKLNEDQYEWAKQVVALYQEQLQYAAEITGLASLFFENEVQYDEEAKAVLSDEQVPDVMKAFHEELVTLKEYTPDTIKEALKAVQKVTGQKGKKLFMPVRVATTGLTHGRDLNQTLFLLGRDKVVSRVQNVINNYEKIAK
ncbi:glutamate--tRNA ligase [Aneurinibacillus thermoaerophilus]|uniref:Glutamate--tRNA ligase n=1 Tax=Aneurinibacillus thermoaerophilus TaxID=143495 RepID=A0A1G8CVA2_ANETH|nr:MULTISPECIES: glutamate--tRNA ligase [Aneurinibacillus]AMA74475.1 glutamate--tRNA ligase [Aneurinibacillus sp. XH2]MED0757832.1 glutamate--tRNA ligase [Aneurinibacillus thermoaerophilus]MED0761992.1 glutamate--tRNA ligase [Aneurinibacillus thermoaerophilus]SDH49163.1 glutamyl-tRNA synthetase /glutamate--tRNA(Gln) ligase [Aneurinibacillus thermoaerophilus]